MWGREQEVGLLMDRWEQVEEGLGQVMLVKEQGGAQGAYGGLPKKTPPNNKWPQRDGCQNYGEWE